MSRPKKPSDEKLLPVAVYMPPELKKKLEESAAADQRSISSTINFMVAHCLKCHIYIQGHVPKDKIPFLRGQGKKK